jgi:hypothetical protein
MFLKDLTPVLEMWSKASTGVTAAAASAYIKAKHALIKPEVQFALVPAGKEVEVTFDNGPLGLGLVGLKELPDSLAPEGACIAVLVASPRARCKTAEESDGSESDGASGSGGAGSSSDEGGEGDEGSDRGDSESASGKKYVVEYRAMLKDFPRLKDDEPGPAEKYNTSAAEEDRLRAGMVLVRASGESVSGMKYTEVVQLLQQLPRPLTLVFDDLKRELLDEPIYPTKERTASIDSTASSSSAPSEGGDAPAEAKDSLSARMRHRVSQASGAATAGGTSLASSLATHTSSLASTLSKSLKEMRPAKDDAGEGSATDADEEGGSLFAGAAVENKFDDEESDGEEESDEEASADMQKEAAAPALSAAASAATSVSPAADGEGSEATASSPTLMNSMSEEGTKADDAAPSSEVEGGEGGEGGGGTSGNVDEVESPRKKLNSIDLDAPTDGATADPTTRPKLGSIDLE